MRRAELVMALCLAAFSVYLMIKSMELPVGWVRGEGPGGGAFPFWLGAGMLICCIAIIVRWAKRTSVQSQSTEPFMDKDTLRMFITIGGSLTVMIGAIHVIGVYFALPLFLMFYLRFLGRHTWRLTAAVAVAVPVFTFFFFEIALLKTLPKGFTEPLFYPLYDMFL
ncbi:MAG: tripartite tricarboxylate transporter TctB family protein [Rhodospirillales bacterium]|nr:tripartite tricarboxylate transporter TctB family protein [Rhodospirillales bacterium]